MVTVMVMMDGVAAHGKSCSYVPVESDDCLPKWGCDYYDTWENCDDFWNKYMEKNPDVNYPDIDWNDEVVLVGDDYVRTCDDDCDNLPDCPANPTEENWGMICEADAAWATNADYEGSNYIYGNIDLQFQMPMGTSEYENNCGVYDVYEVVCVDVPIEYMIGSEPFTLEQIINFLLAAVSAIIACILLTYCFCCIYCCCCGKKNENEPNAKAEKRTSQGDNANYEIFITDGDKDNSDVENETDVLMEQNDVQKKIDEFTPENTNVKTDNSE